MYSSKGFGGRHLEEVYKPHGKHIDIPKKRTDLK